MTDGTVGRQAGRQKAHNIFMSHGYYHALKKLAADQNMLLIILQLSYSTVVLCSRDQYEIIGLIDLKISYSIKQPCSSVCLKSVRNALKMFKQCSSYLC